MSRKIKEASLDIFTCFFEEYFRDRLFDAIEMDSVGLLKRTLNVSNRDFYLVMKGTDEKYQCGEIKYEMSMTALDPIKCLGKALKRVFGDEEIEGAEEELLIRIAEAFDISETMMRGFIENYRLNVSSYMKTPRGTGPEVSGHPDKDLGEDLETPHPDVSAAEEDIFPEEDIFEMPSIEEKTVEAKTVPPAVPETPKPPKIETVLRSEPDPMTDEVYKISTTPGRRKIRAKKTSIIGTVSEDGTYEIMTGSAENDIPPPEPEKDEPRIVAETPVRKPEIPEPVKEEPVLEEPAKLNEQIQESMNEVESLMRLIGNKKPESPRPAEPKNQSRGVMDVFSAMVQNKESDSSVPAIKDPPEQENVLKPDPAVEDSHPAEEPVRAVPAPKEMPVSAPSASVNPEILENSPFPVKGMKMLRRGVPEFRISFDLEVLDEIFISEFFNWTSLISIFYHVDGSGSWLIAANPTADRILAKERLNDSEREEFLSIFSPGITHHYSICFMNEKQKLEFLRWGEIDTTGKHFSGQLLMNSGDDTNGIADLKTAAGNNERISGLCFAIGDYYYGKGQVAQALIFFFKENENFPQNALCNLRLSEVFKMNSKLVRAKEYIEKTSLLNPLMLEYILLDMENLLTNFEKNTDRLLNHLMVCFILWPEDDRYMPALQTVSENTGIKDLWSILMAKSRLISKPVMDFSKIIHKMEAGLYYNAVADCKEFFENHKSFYNQNVEFRKMIESYFETLDSSIPEKEVSDSIKSIIFSV